LAKTFGLAFSFHGYIWCGAWLELHVAGVGFVSVYPALLAFSWKGLGFMWRNLFPLLSDMNDGHEIVKVVALRYLDGWDE